MSVNSVDCLNSQTSVSVCACVTEYGVHFSLTSFPGTENDCRCVYEMCLVSVCVSILKQNICMLTPFCEFLIIKPFLFSYFYFSICVYVFSFHISIHSEMKFICLTLVNISAIMDLISGNDLLLLKSCVLKR